MTTYTLPNIAALVGTFKITVFSDTAGLTKPSINTILEIGDRVETVDTQIGVAQVATLDLNIRDDYQNEPAGFWYNALNGACHIKILLTEGGADKFFFYGIVKPETVVWTEHYIGTTYVRTASITLASMLSVLMDTPTANWVSVILNNEQDIGAQADYLPCRFVTVLELFAAMLPAAGLNTGYDPTDASFIGETPDFYYEYDGNFYSLEDIRIATRYWDVVAVLPVVTDYFIETYLSSADNANYLPRKFATLRDLLSNLLVNFGVVLSMGYNGGRHTIQLIQRGRAYADASNLVFSSREKTGIISSSFDLVGDATRATFLPDDTKFIWFSKKYLDDFENDIPPNYVSFDRDVQCVFKIGDIVFPPVTTPCYYLGHVLYFYDGSALQPIENIKYWNYSLAVPAYETANVSFYPMLQAVAGYLFYRFTTQYARIVRSYAKITADAGAGETFTAATILRRTSIDDGIAARTFYANKVILKSIISELEIEWFKE